MKTQYLTLKYMKWFLQMDMQESIPLMLQQRSFSPQCHEILLFHNIVGHQCDTNIAISSQEAWILSHNGNKIPRWTTKGWELCVEWKDKSTNWIPLKDLKASKPLQVAQYAIAHNIAGKPAFSWWVHDAIRCKE